MPFTTPQNNRNRNISSKNSKKNLRIIPILKDFEEYFTRQNIIMERFTYIIMYESFVVINMRNNDFKI